MEDKNRFLKAWNEFKKDFPNRKTKTVVITNQSKRDSFIFVEAGIVITLFPDGRYTTIELPKEIYLL